MGDKSSRRRFLRTASSGMVLGAMSTPAASAGPDEVPAPASDPTDRDKIPIQREICSEHLDLIVLRSKREHQRVAESLKKQGARPVVVGAYQMANHCGGKEGKEANLQRMLGAMKAASAEGVQILVFPELCLPGYYLKGTPEEAATVNHALADEAGHSDTLKRLEHGARQYKLCIAFGFSEKKAGGHYNAIGVIDADGSWLGSRWKNPLSPHPHETGSFTEPDPSQRSAVFKTKSATVGVSNCFDGEFPESIRRMRLAGAEILLWCNAGSGDPKTGHSARINSSGSYAQANQMWVVCCNAVAPPFYGTSVIVGPSGEPLVILPPAQETLGVATINLALGDWERWRRRLDPIWR